MAKLCEKDGHSQAFLSAYQIFLGFINPNAPEACKKSMCQQYKEHIRSIVRHVPCADFVFVFVSKLRL